MRNSIVLTWTAPQRFDFFRVSLVFTGTRETVRQAAGGTRGRFAIRPVRRNTTYTFKVQGCLRVRNRPANCTPFSDPVLFAIGADGKPIAAALPVAPAPTPTPQAATCPGAPGIASFGASPDNITLGESTTLNWGFVSSADRVEIDNGVGGVATPGSRQLTPSRNTTFRIVATGCGGTASRETTVRVSAFRPNQGFPGDVSEEAAQGNPRVFQFPLEWRAETFHNPQNDTLSGGVVYEIEIDARQAPDSDWEPLVRTDFKFSGSNFVLEQLPWDRVHMLRFRSRAKNGDGLLSPSAFSDYTFQLFQ